MAFTAIFFCIVTFSYVHANGNVCDSGNHVTISDIRRRTENKVTSNYLCDYGLIKDDGWYRFKSVAGDQIPKKNPGLFHCGTYIPIWFKGTYPTTVNNVVKAKACAAAPFILPAGCGISYDINVVKCPGGFYLYQLKEPGQCSLAYCAGEELPKDKPCSYTGDSLPICSGVIPRVDQILAVFKEEPSMDVRLMCLWKKSPGNLTYVEYEARWFNDEKDLKPKIERRFRGTDNVQELLFQPVRWNGKVNRTIGYEFRKNVFCQVRARYQSGNWSRWKSSNRIFTGISVFPTEIPALKDCGPTEREVIVTLRPHLPIRQKPLRIDVFSPRTSLIKEICLVGDDTFTQCGLIFPINHAIGSPLRLNFLTNCGTGDIGEKLNGSYLLRTNFHQDMNTFWSHHKFPEIKLTREKFNKKECISAGDPHFTTFDGNTFDFMGRGTFLLYRNTFYGTEVQVRQRACWTTPSCNCGVAIKENVFFRTYDLCSQSGGKWWEKSIQNRVYTRFLEDFKYSRFYTKATPIGSGTKYEVHLPSGVQVIVTRFYWGFNINLWAPQDPNHPSEGLCGNNNGNPNDYFRRQWDGSGDKFGKHWRVHSEKTIFDYRGNVTYNVKLDRGCGKSICVCGKGVAKLCGIHAENTVCFKSLTGNKKAFGRVNCNNIPRGKRALTPDDDSIDDQDEIPSFNPPEVNISSSLTWPTPNGLTKAEVTQYCENKLRYSKAGKACDGVNGVDIDNLVKGCIYDIQAADDFSWGRESLSSLETTCTASIYNNASSYKSATNGSIELATDVLLSLCPNDCSNHGNCSNATCTCHEDYTAVDCSISLKDSPILFDIRKSGLCDRRRRPCRNVGVFGFPLLDSENLTCHIQEYKVIQSSWTPTNVISLYPGLMVDLTEVKCLLPESPVNIGDYGNEGVTAAGLKIAVSNNRINASKEPLLFITYDSVCQECNTTAGCKLRTDACFISGHCFAKNQSHPNDWCQQCLPEMLTTSWLKRRDNGRPMSTTSNVFYGFKGKELRVRLSATDPENRTIRYSFAQNKTLRASLKGSGLFTLTMNGNGSTIFMFKVTDECGAYSVFNASVVLKKCPCQNSGECIPDYRYLDGAGNFTCSCPAEYTGTLCEFDVDECNVSKPCFKGNCSNEQPGFFCSCFAGYTGNLCQTEIDECAPKPCFLGVPCTDTIASFNCGPCPSEYTGDGENCIRIDGKEDKCVKNPLVCHSNGKCVYHNGSYVCQCTHGYTGDGKNNCTDVDECTENAGACDINANCTNTEGSYACECLTGYSGDGQRNCSDIDECTSLNVCIQNAKCSNTVGSYVCQCAMGYLGDGYTTCAENQSPQFTTPSVVYAIMNTDFEIRIEAGDPEGEDIVYILMSNGTLTSAQITKQGLLTVSHVKENGTVYIRVEDKMGAWNILILHVKAMQCPCKSHGKCYRKPNIPYPVQPSHYFCQCEEPYAGHLCEIRPNPCDEQPCYPGLKCSFAPNSEGFSCEDCPPLFEGDGKHCKLNGTKDIGKNSVQAKMTLTNEEWDDQLTVKTSKVYKKLVSRVTIEIRKIYISIPEFSYFIIKGFSRGSIVVDFELIFSNKVDDPLEPLLKVAKTGKLGNMTFEMNEESDAGDDDGNTLDTTILIVIIVAVVVLLILIIIFGVCRRIRRHRVHREEKLRRKRESSMKDSKPVGISYQEAADGAAGEEMDLKVFDNEAVRLDEDTNLEP